jgi:hypothetical protein
MVLKKRKKKKNKKKKQPASERADFKVAIETAGFDEIETKAFYGDVGHGGLGDQYHCSRVNSPQARAGHPYRGIVVPSPKVRSLFRISTSKGISTVILKECDMGLCPFETNKHVMWQSQRLQCLLRSHVLS